MKVGPRGARSRAPLILRGHLYPQNIFLTRPIKEKKRKIFKYLGKYSK